MTFGAATLPFQVGDFELLETDHAPRLRLPRHDHAAATIVIVQEGEFEETVGRRTFQCKAGTFLVKPNGAHHTNRYGESGSKAILVALPPTLPVYDVSFFRNEALMRRLAFELRYRDAAAALVAEGILLELLDSPGRNENAARRVPPSWLRAAQERLRCDPTAGISLIARQIERDAVHLAREFRRHYGCSPGEYARSARIETACRALRMTGDSISAIAFGTGFYDQSHFTNVFRRLTGVTPAEYRHHSHESSKTPPRSRRKIGA